MKLNPVLYLLCLYLLSALTLAQGQILKGKVLLVGQHDETTPAIGVDVILEETGDTVTTVAGGLFRLFIADKFKAGEEITLQVTKPDWRIQYPLDGETHIPADLDKDRIEIRLLPLGSKKFWSADRIEKFIQDTAEQAKEQVTREGRPEDIDFSRYIKEWATQYGFSAQQAKAEIDQWVAEVQQKQDDLYKLGLAAYAEKNFGKAGELFTLSAKAKVKQLEALDQERERLTEETIRDFRLAGDAEYNNYRFDKALSAYQQALGYVSQEQRPQLWATLINEVALAHHQIGIRTHGPAVHEHLNAAVAAFYNVLQVRTRAHLPQDWAETQNNLGLMLQEQGIRTKGQAGQRLLGQAVTAYLNALQVFTRAQLPQHWAWTQNNLGNALSEQGIRTGGEAGQRLLGQAVTAYLNALQVFTRAQLPQHWAWTQNNLGNALQVQGIRTGGEASQRLLGQAVTAYLNALQVFTRAQLPQQWATTQNNLGAALQEQGIRTGGEAGQRLLGEAVAACRNALQVRTRTHLPQQWAETQNNLGIAFREQGIRTSGEAGQRLLGQAVTAFRNALQVYTRAQLPQDWAETQNDLGLVLAILGEQEGNIEHLHQAKTAIQSAYAFYREAGYAPYNANFKERLNELEQLIEKHQ